MNKAKVIGIGSPFGDDYLGWKCIELLKHRQRVKDYMPQYLSLEYCDRPSVRLLEIIAEVKTVFLIDAIVGDKEIGTIYRLENEKIEEASGVLSTHGFGVANTLQLGRALNMLPSNIILYGIEIEATCANQVFSPAVESAIVQLVERLEKEVLEVLKV